MFSSISRSIHKTPLVNYKSNCYENMECGQFLQQVTQSKLNSEGVFGIEQFIIDDYSEEFMFTPHICKLNDNLIEKDWNYLKSDLKQAIFYEIEVKKPNFFPLDTKKQINLLSQLKDLHVGTLFVQTLFTKRIDNWREVAISQYEEYQNGNDAPSSNKLLRSIQSKVITTLRNFDVKRSPIEEIEQKILSQGYRFEMRLVLFESKYQKEFETKLNNILKQMSYYNELELAETRYKKDLLTHILERRFQINLNHQLLSDKEMFSLLSDQSTQSQPIVIEKPTRPQSVTKSLEESMLLQRAIQLMPFKENQNKEIDKSKAELVNKALKRVNVTKESLKVTEMYQGSSLLKIQMKVPPEITFTTIKKKLVDIQAALGNEMVSIEIGDKPDTINTFIPLEKRDAILFRNVLESEEFKQFKTDKPLPFILGENVNGGYMFNCLSNLRHILVAGATGSGKSVFVNLLIMSLLLNVPADELSLYLIDPKQVEFSQFSGFPQVRKIITDMEKATNLLSSLCDEMERRYSIFAKSGVKNLASYNHNNPNNKIPYTVCVIDEYADLVMVNTNVEDYIVRLSQKARAAGIHLVIATQKPLADIVTSVLKSNLPSVISFRLKTSSDYMTVFGKGIPYTLLGKGDGVAMIEGQYKEFERFQSPILTLDENQEDSIYQGLKELFKDVFVQEEELPEAIVEQPIDKLKRIIATTGETRVSDLGRLMKIGNNAVMELIRELVAEEFLSKQGRGYVVTASEDELEQWRETE